MGDKSDKNNYATFFVSFYSNGLKTQRDAWCYNSSQQILANNILTHIDFYNEQRIAFQSAGIKSDIKGFVSRNPPRISWTRALEWDVEKNKNHDVKKRRFCNCLLQTLF
jgi:predicted helicase